MRYNNNRSFRTAANEPTSYLQVCIAELRVVGYCRAFREYNKLQCVHRTFFISQCTCADRIGWRSVCGPCRQQTVISEKLQRYM